LIALQASTGEKIWSSQVADPNAGYSETAPPTYWNGLLFVGSAESDAGKRGFVAAYSAATGKQVWRYFTVPADGQGWVKKGSGVTGGDVWMPPIIDTKTGIAYFGTGNPFPDNDNSKRPGCNPWTDATVAVNARTGKFLWGHSEVCNDIGDLDSHQPPMIFDTKINGKMVHAVGHGNKSSLYFVYDAATGKVLAQSKHLGTWLPQHGPGSKKGLYCPGEDGGFEYSPPAFSPATLDAYEPGLNYCFSLGFGPAGLKVTPYGKVDGFMGAIDTTTGKVAWQTTVPAPMVGGAMATSGNLVFSGSSDGHFYAFNAATGKTLWKANVGLAVGAAPITYEVNGVQYVAVAVGGFSSAPLLGLKGPFGGTLMVFKLHGGPITPAPSVQTPAAFAVGGLNEVITVKGLTMVNQWVYMDAKAKRVVFRVVAGATTANNGFNFNGYAKGKANFVVPSGWHADFIFTNNVALPHSMAVVPTLKISATTMPIAATPNPIAGIRAGQTQYAGYGLVPPGPGKYYLVCLVPGHITAGMWDYFTVDFTAKAPSIQSAAG
jgi:outer membrane protein assembly factor BamB